MCLKKSFFKGIINGKQILAIVLMVFSMFGRFEMINSSVDPIEADHAGSAYDSIRRNQVVVHYIEAANDKQKWRARNLGNFMGGDSV